MIEEKGTGWRLSRDPDREVFSVLIAGVNWAFELTEDEGIGLASLVNSLFEQHLEIQDQLMVEESIALEMEIDPWWGCLDGDKDSWSLQLILSDGIERNRGLEVAWPEPAAQEVAIAMRKMWDSGH